MSDNGNRKKNDQLGQSHGSAVHLLRKKILFAFLGTLNLDTCFQCGKKITTLKELSVEHKEPWLDSENPKEKFFDLQNIAFSHLSCNASAARPVTKKYFSEQEKLDGHREASRRWKKENRVYDSNERKARYRRLGN